MVIQTVCVAGAGGAGDVIVCKNPSDDRVTKGIKVNDLSRLVPIIIVFSGLTPFSWDGGMITPVRIGWGRVAGRSMVFACWGGIGRGVVLIEGVRAQSVRGMPVSLEMAGVTGTAGFGGAGRKDGGLLEGLAVIWFLRGLPWRGCCCCGRGGSG